MDPEDAVSVPSSSDSYGPYDSSDDDSYSEEDDEEVEEEEEVEQVATTSPARVSTPISSSVSGEVREDAAKRQRVEIQDGVAIAPGEDSERVWSRDDTDGLYCPICLEAWSGVGEHQPSCLPCGHLYGMSCIIKWLRLPRSNNRCPQCNSQCSRMDVRRIYTSRVLVHDVPVQDDTLEEIKGIKQRIETLEAKYNHIETNVIKSLQKCLDAFEEKDAYWSGKEVEWLRKEAEWQKREDDLHMQLHRERTKNPDLLSDHKDGLWRSAVGYQGSQEQRTGCNHESTSGSSVPCHGFVLQEEFQVNGARFFDVDAAGQNLIIARKLSGVGGRHAISKMSLINPHDQEDINLPLNVKVVKDIRVSPFARLALIASVGKKLSVVSLESNNVVLNYDLEVPAWSCTWDMNSSHYVYAGLQNGMLLVFDTRQTARPLESRNGLTGNPIHTICSLSNDSTVPSSMGTLLTASSVGLAHWSIGTDKPSMVPETDNQGVCISLAYCSTSDYLVASYRPKIEMLNEVDDSQPFLTPSSAVGQNVQGSHDIIKRVGCSYEKLGSKFAAVPSIRLPKYTMMDMQNGSSFASADEISSELVLQELPSLATADRLKSYYPIRDINYDSALHASSLFCLSEDKLQFFSQRNI